MGKGDGIRNDGSYLGYDPELGFIKSPEPLDAYDSLKLTVGRDLFSTQDT